jgi:predicted ribosomally synthesized peptide with SipW-like signal peptide
MIALVVMMLGVGSWAVFNDTESVPGTVSAGTLDLDFGVGSAVGVVIDDLKPSEPHYAGPFILHNAGGNPGALDLHFQNVVDSGGVLTEPEAAEEYAGPIDDISNWIDVDWCIDYDVNGVRECTGVVIGKLGQIESMVIDLLVTLAPSQQVELWLSFHLQGEAGNEYQGDQSTFEVEVTMHQPSMVAGATTVRLENKDASWDPILGDDLYGSVTYYVGSGLHLDVEAHGLNLTGQGVCQDTDEQLAGGGTAGAPYGALYLAGYWNDGDGGYLAATCDPTKQGQGVYNYAYVQALPDGSLSDSSVIDADVTTWDPPGLPSGIYSGVKYIIKEVTGDLPGTAWQGVLMEMQTLNFNLQ